MKKYSLHHIAITIISLLFLSSCVTPKPPSGGPDDNTPPVLKRIESKEGKIILHFDENINLADQNQIVTNILPKPEFEVKQDKLIIKNIPVNDKKQIIYFNNSLQDLNANIPLANYIYADKVGGDTFKYSGSVISLFNQTSKFNNCYVVLLDNDAIKLDVADDIYQYNFTKTDDKGNFELSFIPNPDGKKVFCFIDNNNNSYLDKGDHVGISPLITYDTVASIGEPIMLSIFDDNLKYTDTSSNLVIKKVYNNINYQFLAQVNHTNISYQSDTLYNFSLITDSLILSKTNGIIAKDNIYILSSYSPNLTMIYDSSSINQTKTLSFPNTIPKDSMLYVTNGLDSLVQLYLVSDKNVSTITLVGNDSVDYSNYYGILYNPQFFFTIKKGKLFYQGQIKTKASLASGNFKLFLYEDSNLNGVFDKFSLFPIYSGDKVIYNLKDIDIGAQMDVEINMKP